MLSKKPITISEYIKLAPKESQSRLKEMHSILKSSIPKGIENIKWGMPAFSYKRILVMFAGYKYHTGFYPTPGAIKSFTKELSKFSMAKGSVQFPHDKPLPVAFIKRIVKFRIKEEKELDAKWKTK